MNYEVWILKTNGPEKNGWECIWATASLNEAADIASNKIYRGFPTRIILGQKVVLEENV